jgi:hypothetical protein
MRIVQRVGRLYRYGQKKRVVVFNLLAPQTFDTKILHMMYERIDQVVQDMAPVSREFNQGFRDEILGELIEMLDVEDVLEQATETGIKRTQERIDEALQKAREALNKQRELFAYAAGFDVKDLLHQMPVDMRHVRAFVEGMIRLLNIEVVDISYEGRVFDIRLPEDLQNLLPGKRQRMRLTFDRNIAIRNNSIEMMDFHTPFFNHLICLAKSMTFDGLCAHLEGLKGTTLFTAMLRWQNDQGRRMRQEYVVLMMGTDGEVLVNPAAFSRWLLNAAREDKEIMQKGEKADMERAVQALDGQLAKSSSRYLHPESRTFINAGWCLSQGDKK